MAKVTSKLQVTIPKAIAEAHGIRPGAVVDFESAGDTIRLRPAEHRAPDAHSITDRLRSFDEATARQAERDRRAPAAPAAGDRGWRRDDLYDRGLPR